jgi:hypothetical protein
MAILIDAKGRGLGAIRSMIRSLCLVGNVFLSTFLVAQFAQAATWVPLTNLNPGGSTQIMLQLTDGTILVQAYDGKTWTKLTPDIHGSYINGTWSSVGSQIVPREYFASQVLPNGKVWVMGGEYSGPQLQANWTNSAEIFDPVAGTWSMAASYPAQPGCPTINQATGNIVAKSNVIASVYPQTANIQPGWGIKGKGIPGSAKVVSISSDSITMSVNATATVNAAAVTFSQSYVLMACFGDDPSILLPNNQILAGDLLIGHTYLYNWATDSWTIGPNKAYDDSSDEEGWVKLPDGTVLTYDLFQSIASNGGYSEIYSPITGGWTDHSPSDGTASGTIPQLSSVATGYELGPQLRLQDGRVLSVGATQHTGLFTPSTNTWAAGPDILLYGTPFGADDAPGAALPNGHVLFAADAGPQYTTPFHAPTQLFDFDPAANTITAVSTSFDPTLAKEPAYGTRMLMLPTGQVLFSDSSAQLWVYTPDGGPSPSVRPVIKDVSYDGGGLFTLIGVKINGQSAGAAYGDDDQMDSNYPLVMMTNLATGNVYYAKTSNWSSTAVDGGSPPEKVNFTLNHAVTAGNYSLTVIGAGISSLPVPLTVTTAEAAGQ